MDLTLFGSPIDFLEEYRSSIALNVKVHKQVKLSDETLAKLTALNKRTREQVLRYAEEAMRENWWATMQDYARHRGLGELSSAGRSGGWLVLQMTRSKLEELVEEAETQQPCLHCELTWREHVEGKCPFESTTFDPKLTVDEAIGQFGSFARIEDLRGFADEVKEALANVDGNLDAEVLFQLENLDDAYAADVPSGDPSDNTGDDAEEIDP